MDKRKTGVALFITLMVIASIMSIIAVSFTYLERVQKDAGATSALIQANLLYGNTAEVLKRFFPAGSDNNDKLKLLYTMPLVLNEEKSGFSVNLSCKPLIVGPPIDWLDDRVTTAVPDKTLITQEAFNVIKEFYDIEEPNALEELLLEEITGKDLKNKDYEPRLKKQKGIASKKQFDKILLNYALMYDDHKVLSIPWEKYFSFMKIDKNTKIDGNYLSAEFISVAFDIPIEIVQDSWIIGESTLATFLKDNAISQPINNKIYATKGLNAMHCEQTFAYQEQHYKFNFNYIEGRSNNFEFNGQN